MDELLGRRVPYSAQAEQAVLDSVRLLKIDRELRPVSAIGNLNTPRK